MICVCVGSCVLRWAWPVCRCWLCRCVAILVFAWVVVIVVVAVVDDYCCCGLYGGVASSCYGS